MDKEVELESLLRGVTAMMVSAGLFPSLRLLGLPDPISHAGRWAREHPNEAYRLAVDIRDKLVQVLR